ncbi:hypothetical protein LTI14_01230 [Nesterenkonia sp. YGD6]|uniref:hypothetical protein n=1 Tax=Nesterenkonia sp. YGD6 TaxID=2901231 RepID=UPI001F4CD34E|nr:hypothetical protein [Nesterenkonia sp. YGD6]MCH8561847.1 hypothetical protein [Nesterenkonia sp. YGD6]
MTHPDRIEHESQGADIAASTINGGVAEWALLVDIAQVITAISAVIAVIVATWLGLKAIRVAKADNGQAQQEFLYNQVDSVLDAALTLVSGASDLETDPAFETNQGQRSLRRSAEGFRSRLRVLKALRLIPAEREVANELQQFADVLAKVGLARQRLMREGRGVLLQTVFDDTDDATSRLLAHLTKRVHASVAGVDDMGNEIPAEDGHGFSEVSDGSPSVAARLREDLARSDWEPTVNESMRLMMPWVLVELGWWCVQCDEIGTPQWLMEDDTYSGQHVDQEKQVVVTPPRPQQAAEDWLDEWPQRFWNWDLNGFWKLSPEELADELLKDLSAEFLDRLLSLIADLREGLPEVVLK